jgi:hypothetical protein
VDIARRVGLSSPMSTGTSVSPCCEPKRQLQLRSTRWRLTRSFRERQIQPKKGKRQEGHGAGARGRAREGRGGACQRQGGRGWGSGVRCVAATLHVGAAAGGRTHPGKSIHGVPFSSQLSPPHARKGQRREEDATSVLEYSVFGYTRIRIYSDQTARLSRRGVAAYGPAARWWTRARGC